MLMNRLEYALVTHPVRRLLQRRIEAPLLRRMAGPQSHRRVLELGCGQGTGAALALELFGAGRVDGFDLDPRMVRAARRRLAPHGARVHLWIGDARMIAAPDAAYDAVFDYGIVHHVEEWRTVLAEVARVLRPGGRFYAEEVLVRFLNAPLVRRWLEHPRDDRFDARAFREALHEAGLRLLAERELWGLMAWFVSERRSTD